VKPIGCPDAPAGTVRVVTARSSCTGPIWMTAEIVNNFAQMKEMKWRSKTYYIARCLDV